MRSAKPGAKAAVWGGGEMGRFGIFSPDELLYLLPLPQVVREQAPVAIGFVPGGEQGVLVKNILQAEKDLKVGVQAVLGGDEGSRAYW